MTLGIFEPVERFEARSDVFAFGSSGHSTGHSE